MDQKSDKEDFFVMSYHETPTPHYDLLIQIDDVFKSWIIPELPSIDPKRKLLAIVAEEYSLNYRKMDGKVFKDEYGSGAIQIWDQGKYENKRSKDKGGKGPNLKTSLKQGKVELIFQGEKLNGAFALVRTKQKYKGAKKNEWLLIKIKDDI